MAYGKNNYFRKFVWWCVYILIIFFTIIYCSPTARNYTLDYVDKHMFNSNDSIEVITDNSSDSIEFVQEVNEHIIACDTIKLVKGDDKLYKLPVTINGVKMDFSLDTGCSDISMSYLEYAFLHRHGYLKDSDTVSQGTATIANGDTIKTYIVNLKCVEIGNHKIENVHCSVIMNSEAPTLLGQDVLSKIGNVMISYNKNCLIIEN